MTAQSRQAEVEDDETGSICLDMAKRFDPILHRDDDVARERERGTIELPQVWVVFNDQYHRFTPVYRAHRRREKQLIRRDRDGKTAALCPS